MHYLYVFPDKAFEDHPYIGADFEADIDYDWLGGSSDPLFFVGPKAPRGLKILGPAKNLIANVMTVVSIQFRGIAGYGGYLFSQSGLDGERSTRYLGLYISARRKEAIVYYVDYSKDISGNPKTHRFGIDLSDGRLYSVQLIVLGARLSLYVDGVMVGGWRDVGTLRNCGGGATEDCVLYLGRRAAKQGRRDWGFRGVVLKAGATSR